MQENGKKRQKMANVVKKVFLAVLSVLRSIAAGAEPEVCKRQGQRRKWGENFLEKYEIFRFFA